MWESAAPPGAADFQTTTRKACRRLVGAPFFCARALWIKTEQAFSSRVSARQRRLGSNAPMAGECQNQMPKPFTGRRPFEGKSEGVDLVQCPSLSLLQQLS
jgi:hypothetical protein